MPFRPPPSPKGSAKAAAAKRLGLLPEVDYKRNQPITPALHATRRAEKVAGKAMSPQRSQMSAPGYGAGPK